MNPVGLTAKIYYFDQEKDGLFLDCLRPLTSSLRQQGAQRVFLDRHWHGGPHVRFSVLGADRSSMDSICACIRERVSAYLHSAPSTRTLDEQKMRLTHQRLAMLELTGDTDTPLHANNEVEIDRYIPDPRFWGGMRGVELMEEYCDAVLPLVFTIIERSRSDRSRRSEIALRLLLAYSCKLGSLKNGYLFCRSYLEKFIATCGSDPASVRLGFRQAYESRRQILASILNETETARHTRLPLCSDIIEQWESIYSRFAQRARQLLKDGENLGLSPSEGLALIRRAGWPQTFEESPYVRRFIDNMDLREQFKNDMRYRVHALMVNYLYKLLLMIGITAAEKLILLSFVAESVEERYGISPVDEIQRSPTRAK